MSIAQQPWDEIIGFLDREQAATESSWDRDRLLYQLALICWNVLGDVAEAKNWLSRVGTDYFPAWELQRQLLLELKDADRAAALLEEQATLAKDESSLAAEYSLEAALLHLFWRGDAARAIAILSGIRSPDPLMPLVRDLWELACLISANTEGLVALAQENDAHLSSLVQAALNLWQEQNQPQEAIALIEKAMQQESDDPYLLTVLQELYTYSGLTEAGVSLLEQKRALILSHDSRNPELLAVSLDLARQMVCQGRTQEAAAMLDLLDPPETEHESSESTGPTDLQYVNPLTWSELLVLTARLELAIRERQFAKMAASYLKIAPLSKVPALARAYRLRAAQLLGDQESSREQCEALLQANFSVHPQDAHSSRELERHRLQQGQFKELCAQYETLASQRPEQRGRYLRQAAIIAEARLHDPLRAVNLRHDGVALLAGPSGIGDLQRLYRSLGAELRLIEAYEREIDQSVNPDAQRLSLLWSTIGTLQLKLGQEVEAEHAVFQALTHRAGDLLAILLLEEIKRRSGQQSDDLCRWWSSIVDSLASAENRFQVLVKLSRLASDDDQALSYLLRASEIKADETEVLTRLAELSEREGKYEEAVCWLQQQAALLAVSDAKGSAACHYQAGLIACLHLDDVARGIAELEEALRHEPHHIATLRKLALIYKEQQAAEKRLTILRQLIPLESEDAARTTLLLELGGVLEEIGRDTDEVLEVYADALQTDPHCSKARTELERVCRIHRRLDLFAAVLRDVASDDDTLLEQLGHVLQEIEDLEGLLIVKAELAEQAETPTLRAARLCDYAQLLENMGQTELATAQYLQVLEEKTEELTAMRALQRILRSAGKHGELLELLERELGMVSSPEREVEILIELARTREEMGQHDEAILLLERAILLQPENLEALWALERLYRSDNPLQLARVLKHRADIEPVVDEKPNLYLEAAELYASHGEDAKADEAYQLVWQHDPGHREGFTSGEAFLYQRERWHDLLDFYNRAIKTVEEGGRTFRLVDLYLRRGQLQLQKLQQPGEAAASYLKLLQRDPKNESAMKLLESIFVQQQDWRGLVSAYEIRASLVPDNELFRLESLRQAARLAASRLSNDPHLAIRLWEEIFKADPVDSEAIESLEQHFLQTSQHEQLVDLLETRSALAANEEEVIDLHLRIALLCERELEDLPRAVKSYESLRQLQPHHEETLKALARLYEALGQWAACIEVLKDLVLIEANPADRALHYFKCGSIIEAHFNDDQQAIENYQAAIQESSGCLPALHGLRELHLRRQEWSLALVTLETEFRLWDEAREQAGILARMGEIHLQQLQDEQKAVECFKDALAIDAECQVAALALFNVCLDRDDHHQALHLSDSLVPRMMKSGALEQRSRFFHRRGQLLVDRGLLQEAVECMILALELKPLNIEALDGLIALCRRHPAVTDFATIFRDLEQVYRREGAPKAVGHVLMAAGLLSELCGDADTAVLRYQEAIDSAPDDLEPASILATLMLHLRCAPEAIETLNAFVARASDQKLIVRAMLQLAEIHAITGDDPAPVLKAYQAILAIDANNIEAHEGIAGELFRQGKLDQVVSMISTLIERVTQAGSNNNADISRLLCFLGSILVHKGNRAAASESFQRALRLGASNTVAVMALARQIVFDGRREEAQALLQSTLDNTQLQLSSAEKREIRRALAGLHLGGGDLDGALTHYRTLVTEGSEVDDRIALAEIYAADDQGLTQAISELHQVLDDDCLNLHALHLLANLCERSSQQRQMFNVLQVMRLFGWSDERMQRISMIPPPFTLQPVGIIEGEIYRLIREREIDSFISQVWNVVREPLERLFSLEPSGHSVLPIEQLEQSSIRSLVSFCKQLFNVNYAVFIAEDVPGGIETSSAGGGGIVMDRLLLSRPMTEVAFAIGRTMEYLRSGFGLLSRLAFADRLLLGELLAGLLQAPEAQSDLVREFRRGLPKKTLEAVDKVAEDFRSATMTSGEEDQPARWFTAVDQTANKCGLIICDDIAAALRMIAQLGGEEPALGPRGEILVQFIADGARLVHFFLSSDYLQVKMDLFHL